MADTPNIVLQLSQANIYQQNRLILKNVNLSLKKGEFAYLIGRTGSGKSSLLRTLYADLPFMEGTGKVGEYDLTGLEKQQIPFLRRSLGIIFQDFKLLMDRSVKDNLAFVLKATGWTQPHKIKHRIEEVLERVGMRGMISKMPYELSGGEQQRIVIARAMLNRPSLILADEPTGNLDPETAQEILSLFYRIAKTNYTSVLMATHDYSLIERFPGRVFRCFNGKIVEQAEEMA